MTDPDRDKHSAYDLQAVLQIKTIKFEKSLHTKKTNMFTIETHLFYQNISGCFSKVKEKNEATQLCPQQPTSLQHGIILNLGTETSSYILSFINCHSLTEAFGS